MAKQFPKLVNKQFNSPINLYSESNVKEVLERETQVLANGAVGVNFYNPTVSKPTNLQNSAVLRMLEEEEHRQRNGQPPSDENNSKPLRDQIKWPPPGYDNKTHRAFKDVIHPGVKRVAWPPPNEETDEQEAVQGQDGQQLPSITSPGVQNNHTSSHPRLPSYQQAPQSHPPVSSSTYKPASPNPYQPGPQSPGYQQSGTISPGYTNQNQTGYNNPAASNRGWAPVASPTSPQPQFKPVQPQYQSLAQPSQPKPFNQQPSSQVSVQPHYQTAAAPSQISQPNSYRPQTTQAFKPVAVDPPPSTITLRPQAPVSQAPPPVYTSQPATATLKGGKNLRGDLKWPPEDVKSKMEEENRQRIELAKGPACRPRKVHKDYSSFFAQHALNSTYPGYKAPPGTQFYDSIANY